jgi:hypothetical protein
MTSPAASRFSARSRQQAYPDQPADETGRHSRTGSHAKILLDISAMAAKQNILGLIDAARKVRRPPLVGMQFLHERSVGATNLAGVRSGLKIKDLISLLFRHFAAGHSGTAAVPRTRIALRVFTPAGLPAVKISHH